MNSPNLDEMLARFRSEACALGATRDIDEVFAVLWKAYGAATRHYHSRQHVAEALTLLDDLRATLAIPAEVALAIWFHDAVYATYPFAASESRSATLTHASCLRMGIAEPVATRIAAMVRGTKHHAPENGTNERDARALFDVDLAVLGAGPLRYAEYERDIRAEHAWVPSGLYRMQRAKYLRRFAARTRIFHHETLQDRFEAAARRNLEGAIRELTVDTLWLAPHATDEYVVFTEAAAFDSVFPWSELTLAAVLPSVLGGPPRLSLDFGPFPSVGGVIEIDAPYASDVVERIRALPSYDHEAERRGKTARMPVVLYSSERHPPVTGPLLKTARAVYR